MARIVLMPSLRSLAGGAGEVEVDAVNVRQLLRRLGERFPDLAPYLDESLTVAIDGEIRQDDWFAAIAPDSEVHLMPRIGGG